MKYTKGERFVSFPGKDWLVLIKDKPNRPNIVVGKFRTKEDALLDAAAPQMYKALIKAREDINWMLNNEKFLNPDVFDYIDKALAEGRS